MPTRGHDYKLHKSHTISARSSFFIIKKLGIDNTLNIFGGQLSAGNVQSDSTRRRLAYTLLPREVPPE